MAIVATSCLLAAALPASAGKPTKGSGGGGGGGTGGTTGCSATVDPSALRVDTLGTAVDGFPVNSAEVVNGRAYTVSLDMTPAQVVEYDLSTQGVTNQWDFAPANKRVWATTTSGGDLYFGLWNIPADKPNLYRFTTTGQATPLTRVPASLDFTDLDAAPDGTLFATTDSVGRVFHYDTQGNALRTYSFDDPNATGVAAVVAKSDTVYAGSRGAGPRIVSINRTDGSWRQIVAPTANTASGIYTIEASNAYVAAGTGGGAYLLIVDRTTNAILRNVEFPGQSAVEAVEIVGDVVYAATKPSGAVYRVDIQTGQTQQIANPVPNGPNRAIFSTTAGDLVGANAAETMWSIPAGGGVQRTNLLNAGAAGAPVALMALAAGNDLVHAVGNNRLHTRALSGSLTRTTIAGEPKDAEVVGNEVHLGTYPYGTLDSYDPATHSVRTLASWNPDFNRPRDLVWDTAGSRELVGVKSDALATGALATYDQSTTAVTLATGILGTRSVNSVEVGDGMAYLGSDGSEAVVAAVSQSTGEVLWQKTPASGAGAITGLLKRGKELHGLTAQGTYFILDTSRNGRTIHRQQILGAKSGELAFTHGYLYAVSTDTLLRINPTDRSYTTVLTGLNALVWERARVAVDQATCDLYFLKGSAVTRLTSR